MPNRRRSLLAALGAAFLFLLGGCANQVAKPVAAFTVQDAETAIALAKAEAAIDPTATSRIACWQAWESLANAISGAGTIGVMALTEAGLDVNASFNSPQCQAVAGQVMINMVRWSLPLAPLALTPLPAAAVVP